MTAWISLSLSLIIHPYHPSLYCADSIDFPLSSHPSLSTIIILYQQHVFPCLSLLIHPYHPSLYCTDNMDLPVSPSSSIPIIHHYILLTAWISLSLSIHSHHSSLLPGLPNCILYPHRADVSSCWLANTGMFICQCPLKNIANEFIFASPEVSYMSRSSWMVCEIGGKWPYSCCFVGCCFQNLFKTVCSIFVSFPSSHFSMRFTLSKHLVIKCPSYVISSITTRLLIESFFS